MTRRRSDREDERVSRRRGHRTILTTVLIVGEGRETEPNYFDGFKRDDPVARKFSITVKKGKGGSRLQIVQEAINRMKEPGRKYDQAWCVMDVERFQTAEEKEDFRRARQLAKAKGLKLCLSNPSIEVWLLAHFVRTSRHFNDSDAVIAELDKHWASAFGGSSYAKEDKAIFSRLRGRIADAVRNARDVRDKDHGGKSDIADCNSATEMHILVEKLRP